MASKVSLLYFTRDLQLPLPLRHAVAYEQEGQRGICRASPGAMGSDPAGPRPGPLREKAFYVDKKP